MSDHNLLDALLMVVFILIRLELVAIVVVIWCWTLGVTRAALDHTEADA